MSSATKLAQDTPTSDFVSKSIPILELPLSKFNELCKILNQNDKWAKLAETGMKYDKCTIEKLFKVNNPTCDLLQRWSASNPNTNGLFILLSRIQHYRAMKILIPFVDDKYHYLWKEGEGNLENGIKPSVQNARKVNAINNKKSDNETPKILNRNEPNTRRSEGPSNSNNLAVPPPAQLNVLSFSKSKYTTDDLIAILKEKSLTRNITYEDLTVATDDWDKDRIIGQGGFGKVFRGSLQKTDVAIKRIEKKKNDLGNGYMNELQQSFREIIVLQKYSHDNILSIYGFSVSNDSPPCLVYQFMANGSVQDRLFLKHGTQPLTWPQRRSIAKDVARGLQFLHRVFLQKPLIHGDIKSANILLDTFFQAKIGDFGMAREIVNTQGVQVQNRQGTRPYLPKEYMENNKLSTKVDTYSFGIVMYELATGLKVYDTSRIKNESLIVFIRANTNRLEEFIDRKAGDIVWEDANFLIEIGHWCSSDDPDQRPDMLRVFNRFDTITKDLTIEKK